MKLVKVLTLCLASVLSVTMIVGCSKKDNGTTSSNNSSNTSSNTSSATSSNVSSDVSEETNNIESGLLTKVHEGVKEIFGEDYIPSAELDAAYLEEQIGITSDMVKEFIAEGPMISAHVDTFIGIEAAEGKAEEVEKKLNEYRQKMIDDSVQYPMNMPKIQASSVTRAGDYVFFTILGSYTDEELGDEGFLDYYESETKKVVDKINETLNVKS